MNQNLIFFPCATLIIFTFLVAAKMLLTRIKGIRSGAINFRYYKTYSTKEGESSEALVLSRNFSNLLEAPPLFYILCLFMLVTVNVDTTNLILAWAYVVLRIAHSLVHLTSNKINYRALFYLLSWLVFMAIVIRLALRLS